MRPTIAILALTAAVAVGCSDKQAEVGADARKVAATSSRDATEAIEDKAHGFRLLWPGEGWKLLASNEASELVPGAAAAAVSQSGITAMVMVERSTGETIEQRSDRFIEQLGLADKRIERDEAASFANQEARRFTVSGNAWGAPLRYAGWLFAHQGLMFRLVAWGSAEHTGDARSAFDPFFEAFSLRDGPVDPSSRAAVSRDAAGFGWRLVDGLFESAASRLRVRVPAGWRIVVGHELRRGGYQADLRLVASEKDISLTLASLPAAAGTAGPPPTALAAGVALEPEQAGEAIAASVAGQALQLRPYRAGKREYLHAAATTANRSLQLLADHAAGIRGEAGGLLEPILASTAVMDEAATEALAAELGDRTAQGNTIGPHFVVRAGVYRNFAHGIVFTRPKGWWRLATQDGALSLVNRRLGLRGQLIVEPPPELDGAAYHQGVVKRATERLKLQAVRQQSAPRDGLLRSDASSATESQRLSHQLVTAKTDDVGLQLHLWGAPGVVAAQSKELAALVAAIDLEGSVTAVDRAKDSYRDQRLGFSLAEPQGWLRSDRTPAELAPIGTFVRWDHQGRWVGVLAVCVENAASPQWLLSFLEQQLRDRYGKLTRATAAKGNASLAGLASVHVTYSATLQQIDALVIRRDNTLYAVVAVDSGPQALELATKGFALLP